MPDVVDARTRSRMMAGIRSKDTRPEYVVRKGLHRQGLRYQLHVAGVPGRPDLLLPKYHAAIFVHGCFWHGHECRLFKWPATRQAFWRDKIRGNQVRDRAQKQALRAMGMRVCIVWECAIRAAPNDAEELCERVTQWVRSTSVFAEIAE